MMNMDLRLLKVTAVNSNEKKQFYLTYKKRSCGILEEMQQSPERYLYSNDSTGLIPNH